MKKLFACHYLIVIFLYGAPIASADTGFDHEYRNWDRLLAQYVVPNGHQSSVRYAVLSKDRLSLKKVLEEFSAVSPQAYERFNGYQKWAFLINAYNAFTIELVVRHYPVSSIKNIGSEGLSPWKIKFVDLVGKKLSLDAIEHELIPRVSRDKNGGGIDRQALLSTHFALVCAARSCPALQPWAYKPGQLWEQLRAVTISFLTDSARNRFERDGKVLALSKIFDWYGDEFRTHAFSVQSFIKVYLVLEESFRTEKSKQRWLKGIDSAELKFLPYDWSLNDLDQES